MTGCGCLAIVIKSTISPHPTRKHRICVREQSVGTNINIGVHVGFFMDMRN